LFLRAGKRSWKGAVGHAPRDVHDDDRLAVLLLGQLLVGPRPFCDKEVGRRQKLAVRSKQDRLYKLLGQVCV